MKLIYCIVGIAMAVMAGMIGAAAQDHPTSSMPMMGMGDHIEGRIAFLKAELKITDAQLPQWNTFADALRSDAKRRGLKPLFPRRASINQSTIIVSTSKDCLTTIPAYLNRYP